jgi:hypothetical protein
VLPEYAVDFYYAYAAGQDPSSNYVHYAAANMTGANRLSSVANIGDGRAASPRLGIRQHWQNAD